ncbi:SUMF1/EgtB/PvdO family nonheme iron enzyme [Myxococcota bacterium]|nr:SUMF1/EgtB/PvdO family nonheme iron enzyme [Myxococcota bacterium]
MRRFYTMRWAFWCLLVGWGGIQKSHSSKTVPSKTYAFLVGVDVYKNAWKALDYAVDDMEELRDSLRKDGRIDQDNIVFLMNHSATRENVLQSFDTLCRRLQPTDLLLFAFAGHALMDEHAGYLVLHDTALQNLRASSLRKSDLVCSRVKKRVLFLDTFRSKKKRRVPLWRDGVHASLFAETNQVVLAPSLSEQERGKPIGASFRPFIFHITKGLRGEADMNRDGVVSLLELWGHITAQIKEATGLSAEEQRLATLAGEWSEWFPLTYPKTLLLLGRIPSHPQRSKTNWLAVKSIPSGASVYVNDKFFGKTPFFQKISHGKQNIILQKEGFHAWKKTIFTSSNVENIRLVQLKKMGEPSPQENPTNTAENERPEVGRGRPAGFRKPLNAWPSVSIRWIPPGTFRMGSPTHEEGRYKNEGPPREIRITHGFWMWETEVTQSQFIALMGYNPSFFKRCGLKCPVERVTWHNAAMFANRVSLLEKRETCFRCKNNRCRLKSPFLGSGVYSRCKGWRLPTESEWEYAARAGQTTSRYAENWNSIAWCKENSQNKTSPVGAKRPNPWGLHDMLGNVWEWTLDAWIPYRERTLSVDPLYVSGSKYVSRGGAWSHSKRAARFATRARGSGHGYGWFLGFRLVRSAP